MGLKEVIIEALTKLLKELFDPLKTQIQDNAPAILDFIIGTKAPNSVFGRPTNGVWPTLYDYYWESIVPLALALWGLSIGLVILLESTSNLFSGYQTSRLKRRALSGLLGILSWWWIAALSLQFVDALSGFLVPDLTNISLFQTVSVGLASALAFALSVAVSNVVLIALAVVYLARELAIYAFALAMPILIAMWIPGLGPFAAVAGLAKRVARFYVPFLLMTVPTALLFRLGELLGANFGFSGTGLLAWLTALVIPVLAILAPVVLFWQAGSLYQTTTRMGRQVSTARARRRFETASAVGSATVQGGRRVSSAVRNTSGPGTTEQSNSAASTSHFRAVGSRMSRAGPRTSASEDRTNWDANPGRENRPHGSSESGDRDRSFEALRPKQRTPSALPPAPKSEQHTDEEGGSER
ncbi:hypothetical protein [Halorubellus salinus]|uniref:hypothetical protein n=1 Tax=Halorubellus salinus TaxID=755309 RepID=UPI001D05DF52|nr:hypothetical protein [Halorubellus salinus]